MPQTENQILAARLLKAFPWLEEDFADVGGGDTVQELQDLYEDMLSGDAPVSPEPEQSPTATATGQGIAKSAPIEYMVGMDAQGDACVYFQVLKDNDDADFVRYLSEDELEQLMDKLEIPDRIEVEADAV